MAQAGADSKRPGGKAKVSFVTIARIESGIFDPRLSTLRALAKALKVRVVDLIDEE